MLRATKTALNFAFFTFSAAGFAVIFFDHLIKFEYVFFIPTSMVIVYAGIVHWLVRECYDSALSDHHIDTIYFLGFLYTLSSLITLFYKLQSIPKSSDDVVSYAFYYVGVSVSTSIAGVLFRNISRGVWLRDHPEDNNTLEKSYEMLKSIAESFSRNYQQTFENIQIFLEERRESMSVLSEKEKAYLGSLERFISATNSFSESLDRVNGRIIQKTDNLNISVENFVKNFEAFSGMGSAFYGAGEKFTHAVELVPFEKVNSEMRRFSKGVEDLNLVLDSLIEVLEAKVEKVR